MLMHKTQKARDVLTSHSQALSQAERRILILCDGKRDHTEILKLLGPEAQESLEVLLEQGYLTPGLERANVGAVTTGPIAANEAAIKRTIARLFGAAASPSAPSCALPGQPATAKTQAAETPAARTPPLPAPAATTPAAPAAGSSGGRRSLSAAKMYMLDMLQLQRSIEASSIAVSIQTSTLDGHLVWSLLEGLRHLHATTKASVCERIAHRLREILPHGYLDALDTCWSELRPAAPEAGVDTGNVVPMRREVA